MTGEVSVEGGVEGESERVRETEREREQKERTRRELAAIERQRQLDVSNVLC